MRILFQGDSITDVYRTRDNDPFTCMGIGYPLLVNATLGFENPGKYEFFNRGISGNRIVDVYARIKNDIINLKPDVMSILIGVNDVWHEIGDDPNGVDNDKFFRIYDMLIQEIKDALPDIKIMILEPFVLNGRDTKDNWEYFDVEVKKRAVSARKIAEKHNLKYIPLQEGFDKLSQNIDTSFWLRDGVHPSHEGAEYIKREWIKAFNTLF